MVAGHQPSRRATPLDVGQSVSRQTDESPACIAIAWRGPGARQQALLCNELSPCLPGVANHPPVTLRIITAHFLDHIQQEETLRHVEFRTREHSLQAAHRHVATPL
jgi:hypothetical protein